MKRLKVLFLPARFWYPSEVNPMAGVFVREHAKAAALYNDVTVLYAYFSTKRSLKSPWRISDQIEEGIRTIRIACQWKIPLSNYFVYYWAMFVCFRRLLKEGWKPDVIHAHVFPAGLPSWFLSRIYRVPYIISEHWTGFLTKKLTILGQMKARFVIRQANAILPVSAHLAQHLKSYCLENRVRIVPNPVNNEVFYPIPVQIKRAKKRKILSVTALRPQKGVPFLLKALSQIKEKQRDFILDIVGDGPDRNEYERLVGELGLDGIVRFHGSKNQKEVARLMRNCDFFVQASLWETFGVVYIEAMACGKPVLASDIGGPREIVNSDAGILVPPGNAEALAQAIEYMVNNHQNYSAEKIARYAKERFGYRAVGSQLSEIYHLVLSEGQA